MNPPLLPGYTVFEIDPDLPLPPEVHPATSRVSLVVETSYPDRWRPWLVRAGAAATLACAVLLAFGIPWGIPLLPAGLAALYVGLRGQERHISLVASPRGRFVLLDETPARPADEPEPAWPLARLAANPAVSIPFIVALALLAAYFEGGGKWLPVLGLFLFLATCWGVPEKLIALVNARSIEAPASERFLALADPRHPLAPEAAGTPRRSPGEALREVGRAWTRAEYRELCSLILSGVAEDEACRRVRGGIAPPVAPQAAGAVSSSAADG